MNIIYDNLTDILYIRLDDRIQKVINKQIANDTVLDLGKDEKLVGIEIINASKRIKINNLLQLKDNYQKIAI
ncbi:MAG: DUF2283 domain-containing protein [Actinobacteria bacterium]|nr:DUF2283 domain-containing protein [Actinomycetota bacterium]MCL6087337.1 DUF2283 domain-containing protein [Actinomycetota bacterium]